MHSSAVCCGSWLETPPKGQKPWEKFLQNFISSRDGPEKGTETMAEMNERKKTTLLQNDGRNERTQENYPTTNR